MLVIEDFAPAGHEKFYRELPFEMPPGVCRLEVAYEYSDVIDADPTISGGNTLDIGVYDHNGGQFLGAHLRGWSGSERDQFFITPTEATPGYLPGPLTPGLWHIGLGFYKVGPKGCRYRVTIRFEFGDVAQADFPPLLALSSTASIPAHADGWYRGELHCHTIHSDGDSTPGEVIAAAKTLGLDFLAITDHNNWAHLAEMATLDPQGLILIPGCEVTTFKGHWNIWGALDRWIDFRVMTPEQMDQAIRLAVQSGYLTSCNHPRTYGPPWEFSEVRGNHCIEVWNGPWRLFNHEALAFWERRLRAGEHVVAVGGSDMHHLKKEAIPHIGAPTTWIYLPGEPTAVGLVAGLRAGHAFLSDAPDGPRLRLTADGVMMGDAIPRPIDGKLNVQAQVMDGKGLSLELHDANGCQYSRDIASADEAVEVSLTAAGYVRAQLVEPLPDEILVRALTNPIYLI